MMGRVLNFWCRSLGVAVCILSLTSCGLVDEKVNDYPEKIQSLFEVPLEPDGDMVVMSEGQITILPDTTLCGIEGYVDIREARKFFSSLGQKWMSDGGSSRIQSSAREVCKSGRDIVYFLGLADGNQLPVRRNFLVVWQADGLDGEPKAWWFGGRLREKSVAPEFANSEAPPLRGHDYAEVGGRDRASELGRRNLTREKDVEQIQGALLAHLKEARQ